MDGHHTDAQHPEAHNQPTRVMLSDCQVPVLGERAQVCGGQWLAGQGRA